MMLVTSIIAKFTNYPNFDHLDPLSSLQMRRWTTIMERIALTMRIPTNSRHNAQEEEEKRRVFGEAYQAAIWNTVDQFLRRLRTVDVSI